MWLDFRAPNDDYGLARWNDGLNRMYWFFAAGLPVLLWSRLVQPEVDFGHRVAQWFSSALVFVPFLMTIVARRRWVPDCRERATAAGYVDAFRKQSLWPFESNNYDRLGISLCFVIWLLATGFDVINQLWRALN